MPGWTRRHFALAVGVTILLAVLLRVNIAVVPDDVAARADRYLPVAAAIGLTDDIPADAALSTWINSGLYAIHYTALSIRSPETSLVDFCAAFLADPESFCALADIAALVATAISIILAYRLVSQLLDPIAGVAATFVVAIHPAAVALTAGIDSGAFSLLFLLCGLSIAARVDWRAVRGVDMAAIGLSLGFALDAIPLATPLLVLVIVLGLRAVPATRRLRFAGQGALGLACFGLAAAAVIPRRLPMVETVHIMALSTIIVVALLVATHALRSLRDIVSDSAYSSAMLFVALGVGIFAMVTVSPTGSAPLHDPAVLASNWLTSNAPADSAIVVHPDLSGDVTLPRNAASWRREYRATLDGPEALRLHALAAERAARRLPGPRFDVLYRAAHDPTCATASARAELPSEVCYVVLPQQCDPNRFGSDGFWLVARFRATDSAPGVIIWGTQAAPNSEPIHVEWRMKAGRMLSALPTQ